eukprot:3054213-Alexandrium_andersonii.AAC.1
MQQLHDMRSKRIRRCRDGDAAGCGGAGERRHVASAPTPSEDIPLAEAAWRCPIPDCDARLACESV